MKAALRRHLQTGGRYLIRALVRVETEGLERIPQEREAMTREVMWQLAALLPAPYRGAYADLERATERYLRFPSGAKSHLGMAK
ncbi:MAG: hypothetical protein ACPL7C_02225 [Anaerolineae bacterium]|jgi:hypothetical protein